MAKTLSQLEKQIRALQREAEALRKKEVAGVIARIQQAIAHYGLSVQDLFADRQAAPGRRRRQTAAAATKKAPSPAKYRDEAGHTWSGHGKRPNWFKAAIAAGKTPAELEIKG